MSTGQDSSPWIVATLLAVGALGIALVLMKSVGLLDIPKDDTGAKTIAAALALVGALFTGAVTLVGTVLKYSIDDRAARLAVLQSDRNHALANENARLANEAEQRNKIEAASRVLGLLPQDRPDASNHQTGGALLALVSLGQVDLATALLADLWPANRVSRDVAELVLTSALDSGNDQLQMHAANVLSNNASRIADAHGEIWPIAVLGWRSDLSYNCRLGLVDAAVKWMKSDITRVTEELQAAIDSNNKPHNVNLLTDYVTVLFRALDDADETIREIAALSLAAFLAVGVSNYVFISGDGTYVPLQDARSRAENTPQSPGHAHAARIAAEVEELVKKFKITAQKT